MSEQGQVLGQRLKLLRESQGKTLDQVAGPVGIAKSTLHGYETGRREPDLSTIQKLAHALNTTVSYLIGETDDPSPLPAVAAAHREGAEPGTPLPPEVQLIIERAMRSAMEELYELQRRKEPPKEPEPEK